MADIKISLSNVQNIKKVHIEEIGDFKVRKLGAGEELDLSDKMRRLDEILTELGEIDFSSLDKNKKKDLAELKRISKRAAVLGDEIAEIQRFELETYKRCFTDDNGGKNVELLLNSLSAEDRGTLFKAIFDPLKKINKAETVEDDAEEPIKPVKPSTSPSTKGK